LLQLLEFHNFCLGERGPMPIISIAYAMVRQLELAKHVYFLSQHNLSEYKGYGLGMC
jgi:hypothetical protein